MKSSLPPTAIHKRLYNVLPRTTTPITPLQRPRSNSASLHTNSSLLPLTFFDTPPPPSSRLPPPQPPRVPAETKPHNSHSNTNPNPYALTPSRPSNHDSLQLLTASLPYGYQPSTHFNSPHLDHPHNAQSLQPRQKRARHRYHLDVGAYGIPKKSRHSHRAFTSQASIDNSHLSVQIGEDAYFVRDNAMGVADGVGGWARSSSSSGLPCGATDHSGLTPSALFARRLMHFTSEQLEEADFGEPVEDLDSHLEDLADGIDVLQILERAYDQTVKAHVAPETKAPLHTGSSTALVAVLDHAAPVEHDPERDADMSKEEPEAVLKIAHVGDCMGMLVRGDEIVWRSEEMWWAWNTPVQLAPPRPSSTVASSESSRSMPPPSTLASLIASTSNFLSNPLFPSKMSTHQPFDPPPAPAWDASGSSPTASTPLDKATPTPRNSAQVLTVPVRPDDILILASDGLSDNLWDEDILDEVVRFKKLYDAGAASRSEVGGASITTRTEIRNGAIVASTSTIDGTSASTLTDCPLPRSSATTTQGPSYSTSSTLQRHTLAAMLSEALCSRAQHTSERRSRGLRSCHPWVGESRPLPTSADDEETPFSRRAKEVGKAFEGGKRDDISVLVAIVAPAQLSSSMG